MRRIKAFTLVEIIVVVLVLSLLAGITYTIAVPAKESARRSSCSAQLKNIYSALSLYAIDNDAQGLYPELHGLSYVWDVDSLLSYLKEPGQLICPSTPPPYRKGVTYIVPIFFKPIDSNGNISQSRLQTVNRESKEGTNLVIVYCTVHDEVFFAPHETHVDPLLAQRFLIQLTVTGSVRQGRVPQFRDFPVTGR
jgi:prepilin-type N-terminal cleavage/methylation domain-containing protein